MEGAAPLGDGYAACHGSSADIVVKKDAKLENEEIGRFSDY